ncbi:hypothetical protein BPAE_0230g00160 [Botrytis paeoniae]|uniref:Uncharacterized protein n=1 Tax=Botrytis paeoniae TaxID=278948 RepID=A0A4Z1FA40_9HELO|nr:hypothetical protein BPAE_0230g00160 [Botrytis paeoniae]
MASKGYSSVGMSLFHPESSEAIIPLKFLSSVGEYYAAGFSDIPKSISTQPMATTAYRTTLGIELTIGISVLKTQWS